MLEENVSAINRDVKTLVNDAQALLQAATTLTGEKAAEMQNRGMRLLDTALLKAQEAQANALASGKRMAVSTDGYVRENPWRAVGTAAGVGLLLGVNLGRR